MKNIYKYGLSLVVIFALGITSCDDALDINVSPNSSAVSTPAVTLPVAQASLAYAINLDLGILAGFQAQYWTQAPQAAQYQVFDQYTYNGTSTSTAWGKIYAETLTDLKFVREQSLLDGTPNYAAIADILTAYSIQVLTDYWGDVPFTDALGGLSDNNTTPKYDDAQSVYDELIVIIDRGLSNVDLTASAINPAVDDFVFGGNMQLWIQFANTLKLRIYIRQASKRASVAQNGIQGLYNSGAEFLSTDALVAFPGGTWTENPYYSGDVSLAGNGLAGNNVIGSNSVLNRLSNIGDPRLNGFYNAATSGPSQDGNEGLDQGVGANTGVVNRPVGDFSTGGSVFSGASSPVYFFTTFESLFLQAEAVERGWGTGNAQDLYNSGVQASFDLMGAGSAASFTTGGGFYDYGANSQSGTPNNALADIHYQKWIAMNGCQNVEAWSEFRRTGVPDLVASAAGALLPTVFPQRVLYPTSEVSNNPNTPAVGTIDVPIWWALN